MDLTSAAGAAMADEYSGMTAIVTGAGSGIGFAAASRLAAHGARVVVVDVIGSRVDAALAALNAVATAATAIGVVADVADQGDVDRIVNAAGGRIDILANVAGIMDGFLPVGDLDDETWWRVINVNLTAPMRLTRAVLPSMLGLGRGSIVNVASEAALRGSISGTAYAASKHGLIGLTRSTAALYGPLGIRCNAVCPGPVETQIEKAPRSEFAVNALQRYLATVPRRATPEMVAAAICWLASTDSMNVNGAVLPSDGGWSAT